VIRPDHCPVAERHFAPRVAFELQPAHKEFEMNRDQAKGRMKEAAGKVQQKAGKAAGSLKHQAKGLAKQATGKVQKSVGDARNDAEKDVY
jgi:uncharacterized protein YjbJ (UPF0337 family)